MKLNLCMPVAYDWKYAINALRTWYNVADAIYIGLDVDRVSWAQKEFDLNKDEFEAALSNLDTEGKIVIVERNFHRFTRGIANDTATRNLLRKEANTGTTIQVDSDEELLFNSESVRSAILGNPGIDIWARHYIVWKELEEHYLIVKGKHYSPCVVASECIRARETDNKYVCSDEIEILHRSWGRTEAELVEKLKKWSHAEDADWRPWIEIWRGANENNYHVLNDLWPLLKGQWKGLDLVPKEVGR